MAPPHKTRYQYESRIAPAHWCSLGCSRRDGHLDGFVAVKNAIDVDHEWE